MELESSFVPSYFQVVDEIPKTASEKPLERVLLQEFSAAAANVFSQ
jgi:crotonobetaine/carnitine-CoA ligase